MADLGELVGDVIVRSLETVARTADEIRNGVLLARSDRNVALEPVRHRYGARR